MIQRSDTLKEQAYALLRDKILKQELRMGERLNIAALTKELKISNSPLREAIAILEKDGLVESTPNAGYRVITMDTPEMTLLTQTLLVLLDGCYLDCIRKNRVDHLKELLANALHMQREEYTGKTTYTYVQLAINFDRCFVDACENSMLSDMFSSKFALLVLATLYEHQDHQMSVEQNFKDHQLIYEAVLSDDVEAVRKLLATHYDK